MSTVFFLSDYGTRDEFVGVVHAVLIAAVPGVTIVDLTHQIDPFDVRAGARALARAGPHLGPGVVLAVVDPGVGSQRRGIGLAVAPGDVGPGSGGEVAGPTYFVGPDNGLLIPAAELVGGGHVARAVELAPPSGASITFDGRDVFAPAAALLSRGVPLEELGPAIDPSSLQRQSPPSVAHGHRTLRAEVLWVDRFGNLQLAVTMADAELAELPRTGPVDLVGARDSSVLLLRRVETFADLAHHELGLLLDANGHLAVVAGQASASAALQVRAGDEVTLTW